MKNIKKETIFYIYAEEHLKKHYLFFNTIINTFNIKKINGDIVAVLHLLPDAIPFTKALKKIGNLKTVIPKPKSVNKHILDFIQQEDIKIRNKENIEKETVNLKQKTVFLDIGGYFSPYISTLKQEKKFVGIVEDTENGLQKYQKLGVDFPFLSVARSPLKDNEDFLVGLAIVYSVERILREQNILINGTKAGVIGFGKIGASVAENLLGKKSEVSVFDKNNIALVKADSQGFVTVNKNFILKNSDLICLATGNMSLTKTDFKMIKNGAFLFSITSSDDEFDKSWLENNYTKIYITPTICKYTNHNHYFYLLNDGETINFLHGTTVGEFILLVHAELLVSAYKLLKNRESKTQIKLSDEERDKIAQIWLEIFRSDLNQKSAILHQNLIESLEEYKLFYNNENIHTLLEYAKNTPDCISRKNKEGHFTASGFVIFKNKVLLVFHNKLQKYLQPGGHLEDKDLTLIQATKREVEEETGLKVVSHKLFENFPIHIDIHKIPENKKKNEPEHFHYDCMFVFELSDNNFMELNLQKEEVSGYQWVSLDYDFKDPGIKITVQKIKEKLII